MSEERPTLPLTALVQQLLIGRTEGMSAPQLAAFVDGWTSLLELLRRPEVWLAGAASVDTRDRAGGQEELRAAMARVVESIEAAQRVVLGEG